MIVLTFHAPGSNDGALRLGVRTPRGILDVQSAKPSDSLAADPTAFFARGLDGLAALTGFVTRTVEGRSASEAFLDERSIDVGPCVPAPGKIICIGLNYRRHAAEAGMKEPSAPVLFSKFKNAVAASGEPVPLPANAVEYDYEAELGVVIGRRARHVSREDALTCVLGYCNANDLSARDLQFVSSQWLLGKTLDKFLPIGPWLVTADEIRDPQALSVRGWLNGELRQNSNTSDMIFTVAEIVSYLSRHFTLEPGDVIVTGTPEGVIFGMPEKTWMKPGDEYAIEIGPLGRLVNRMVAEPR